MDEIGRLKVSTRARDEISSPILDCFPWSSPAVGLDRSWIWAWRSKIRCKISKLTGVVWESKLWRRGRNKRYGKYEQTILETPLEIFTNIKGRSSIWPAQTLLHTPQSATKSAPFSPSYPRVSLLNLLHWVKSERNAPSPSSGYRLQADLLSVVI